VVVLDLRMPGVDGFEVCRLIKSDARTRRATVIAVTAYSSEDTAQRVMECGGKLCLSKPLDLDELVAEVEKGVREARG
jgi:DNA-binding response OmpR family regulator